MEIFLHIATLISMLCWGYIACIVIGIILYIFSNGLNDIDLNKVFNNKTLFCIIYLVWFYTL